MLVVYSKIRSAKHGAETRWAGDGAGDAEYEPQSARILARPAFHDAATFDGVEKYENRSCGLRLNAAIQVLF